MFSVGPVAFAFPLLLAGLLALPVLWFLLRAVPPAPIRRRFPGIVLLLGLQDDDAETDRTPWWLLLLRCAAIALAIIAFAGPVLNPRERGASDLPLLIAIDGTWASAANWNGVLAKLEEDLSDAARDGRRVAMVSLSAEAIPSMDFRAAADWQARLASFSPNAWSPQLPEGLIGSLDSTEAFDTIWISDGLEWDGREKLFESLSAKGSVTIVESARPVFGLRPPEFEDGTIALTALRNRAGAPAQVLIETIGRDPAGTERVLMRGAAEFSAASLEARIEMILPDELRNRVTRFQLANLNSAGAVSLTDDSLRRREIALLAGQDTREGLDLLSPVYYLETALSPNATLLDGEILDIVPANPDVIILADVARLTETQTQDLSDWVEEGGVLVRFAGPRMAASDVGRRTLDPLMPVRLREGGRFIGGAMSWDEPKSLRPFDPGTIFFGLTIPDEVSVTAQVVAQPDPDLADRVLATLSDGTPLITRRTVGQGQIILFHVTANAQWSTLPLSGLFVQMLERLAISVRPERPKAEDLVGTTWAIDETLNAFGRLEDATNRASVAGEELANSVVSPTLPAGLYLGAENRLAVNVLKSEQTLSPPAWPVGTPIEGFTTRKETPLKGYVLSLAMVLLLADILASLLLAGRLKGAAAAILLALAGSLTSPSDVVAQSDLADDEWAIAVTSDVVLAYVETGDPTLDRLSMDGLRGLSDRLFRRTSIEPAPPVGVNLETDEIGFFPFLYWPITADLPIPSETAYARLSKYLRAGGMIMFDTRDGDEISNGTTPQQRRLRAIARPLDIPPLAPIPEDHVLTRSFYLLQEFPGRYFGHPVWVEAPPADATQVEGMPFRNLNDGVTPVIFGRNDWASAWAIGQNGAPLYPVGRGFAGERQREIAYRFGINLIMHVLTGNYKSDQVHVPALLDRLGSE